jgi:hypothetical protein
MNKKIVIAAFLFVVVALLVGQNATTGRIYTSAPQRVGGGAATFATTAIASGACSATVTVAVSGALTSDSVSYPTYTTAPAAATDGRLIINAWMTSGNVNFCRENPTAASITPTAMVVNFVVTR